MDDKRSFISGTIAKFRLKVVDKFNSPLGSSIALQYSIKIYDEAGNLDLHPQLNLQNEAEPGFVLIEFRTAKAGRHYVFIGNNTFYVPGSPFAYDVVVGKHVNPSLDTLSVKLVFTFSHNFNIACHFIQDKYRFLIA